MSKSVKVGILIVAGVVLFGLGLFLIGSSKQLFTHHYSIYTEFNNIASITKGANVQVSGMDAGTVDNIEIPGTPSDKFRIELKVDEKFRHIIRQDSVATVATQGMVGNQFVEIKKGTDNSPECNPGCTIKGQEAASISQLMQQGNEIADQIKSTIKDLHGRADTAMGNITDLTGHADQAIKNVTPAVQKIAANGVRISGNANEIVANVRSGKGAAGKLLMDQQTAQDVTTMMSNAKQTTANADDAAAKADKMIADIQEKDIPKVDQTVTNVQDATSQLNGAVGTFLSKGNGGESTPEALRDTIQHANQATGNLADDTEAIKHNFFFRGFFKRRGFYSLAHMTPSEYGKSEFIKKPAARIWVSAAGLFEIGPDGAQKLTPDGASILARAFSGLVHDLPNNPLMVEAYSHSDAPDQEYLFSEQRADLVRRFLESRFQVKSKWIGVMPFEDQPPPRAGRTKWDGISIVVIQSKQKVG
jgi:phospholipid/cholesterol/gamma-HCH transport system substrate-binding protein